jgi:ABC-type bacteriocin/lantibiotic exporter with double-glycine peptidase domain
MPFISVASDPQSIYQNEYLSAAYEYLDFSSERSFLTLLGGAVIFVIVLSNVSRAAMSYVLKRYGAMRLHSLSYRLLKRYLRQPYIYFVMRNSSELSKNILSEVGVVINKVLMPSLEMLAYGIVSVFIVGLLIATEPLLALLVAVVLSLSYTLIYIVVRKKLLHLGEQRLNANRDKYKLTNEAFNGIKDVKILRREKTFIKIFEEPSKLFALNDAASNIISDIPKYALETVAFGGILIILLYLIQVRGDFQQIVPVIGLYAFAGYRLMPALQRIFNGVTKIRYHQSIVGYIKNEFENTAVPEKMSFDKVTLRKGIELRQEIRLEDIRFLYPNTHEDVVKDQSLTIKANTTIGLVGPTGCGKTTLVDIILGLLTVQAGNMYVDGIEITQENVDAWQANLGYVPQNIYLTDDTIAKNIAFGVPEDEVDFNAVKKAASVANLSEFVEKELERGYDTIVGDRGIRLSGGQRQRIGIARALYHDPSVLILDEATSALDGLTEMAIMDAIHNLSHQKTIIMIAHRLTTVKECDVIYVMDKGRIVDSGKYDELIQRNERFRRMAEGS